MRRVMMSILTFTALAVAAPASANIFTCMDCVHRAVFGVDGRIVQDAECCLAVDGHCYTNDWIQEPDRGFGCQVSAPDERGWEWCRSNNNDLNCGGGGTNRPPVATYGGDSCVANQYGWCDVSCSSCQPG